MQIKLLCWWQRGESTSPHPPSSPVTWTSPGLLQSDTANTWKSSNTDWERNI